VYRKQVRKKVDTLAHPRDPGDREKSKKKQKRARLDDDRYNNGGEREKKKRATGRESWPSQGETGLDKTPVVPEGGRNTDMPS